MGFLLLPTFDRSVEESEIVTTGEVLGHVVSRLDEFARVRGVRPLAAFSDLASPPPRSSGLSGDALGHSRSHLWYDPKEGISAIRDLMEVVKSEPQLPTTLDDVGRTSIIFELQDLVRQLEEGARQGARFRFDLR